MEHVHRRQSRVHKTVEEDLGGARIELKIYCIKFSKNKNIEKENSSRVMMCAFNHNTPSSKSGTVMW